MEGKKDDLFGEAVSISDNYAIVGAYGVDNKGSFAGSAYVYCQQGNSVCPC